MKVKLIDVLTEEEMSALKRTNISSYTEIRNLTFAQLRVLGLEVLADDVFGTNIVAFASVVLTNRAVIKQMAIF